MEKLEKLLVAEAHDTHPCAVCKVHVAAWLWSFGASSPGEVCTPCAPSTQHLAAGASPARPPPSQDSCGLMGVAADVFTALLAGARLRGQVLQGRSGAELHF